jgi:hypothetical protein
LKAIKRREWQAPWRSGSERNADYFGERTVKRNEKADVHEDEEENAGAEDDEETITTC